ncbi:unnamed protein product, partial [Allacma fusca]
PSVYSGVLDKVFIHHDTASSNTARKSQAHAQDVRKSTGVKIITNSEITIKSPDASQMVFLVLATIKTPRASRSYNRKRALESPVGDVAQSRPVHGQPSVPTVESSLPIHRTQEWESH